MESREDAEAGAGTCAGYRTQGWSLSCSLHPAVRAGACSFPPLHLWHRTPLPTGTSPSSSPVRCSKGKLTQQAPSRHSRPWRSPAGSFKTSSCTFTLRRSSSSLCEGAGVKLPQRRVQLCLPTLTMALGRSCHPTALTLPPEKWEIRFSLACIVRIIA